MALLFNSTKEGLKMKREIIVKLKNKNFLELHFSESAEVEDKNCDSIIDYTLYSDRRILIDGGQFEYNSITEGYNTIEDAIEDVIYFICSDTIGYEETTLDVEDGFAD